MTSNAPTEIWADYDYDKSDGVTGLHVKKENAQGNDIEGYSPICYIRADLAAPREPSVAEAAQYLRETPKTGKAMDAALAASEHDVSALDREEEKLARVDAIIGAYLRALAGETDQ